MRKFLAFALLAIMAFAPAQGRKFVIRGEMHSNKLCYSDDTVKEVKLEVVIDGVSTVIATSAVENGKFSFEGTAPEMFTLCSITGFDNVITPLMGLLLPEQMETIENGRKRKNLLMYATP